MRKKVVFILAVPALFLMSLFFLMADIKNIPENSEAVPNIKIPKPDNANVMTPFGKKQVVPQVTDYPVPIPNDNQYKGEKLQVDNDNDDKKYNKHNNGKDDKKDDKYDYNKNKNDYKKDDKPYKDDKKQNDNNNYGDAGGPAAEEMKKRREAVKDGYLHAWRQYETYVWGRDELKPQSLSAHDWLDMGLSIIDSIDTMYLMDLKDEYEKARRWVSNNLNFGTGREISLFETTIRVLGGLLSIHDLTGDPMYVEKANALGRKLLPAFGTASGIPYTTINLATGQAHNPQWASDSCILSEAGTVQLEFSLLSKYTGDPIFKEKAIKVYDVLDLVNKPNGLYPVYVDPYNGNFRTNRVTLGALGDSFYEYLLKYWIMTGKTQEKYRVMYENAMEAVISQLVKKSTPSGLTYIAEKEGNIIVDKMDHLVCFAGAMFALGAYHNATRNVALHLELGKEITKTCHEFYVRQATGLSPELVRFSPNADFRPGDNANHYILRPETVESYYVLYWITGDTMYQDWGWEAFQAMEKYCRGPNGYSGVRDVTTLNVERDDLQQSFFMAETLKYLYLLFSPRDKVPLDKWVFNTEAHPLKVWNV